MQTTDDQLAGVTDAFFLVSPWSAALSAAFTGVRSLSAAFPVWSLSPDTPEEMALSQVTRAL
jgi:hypothetical protein